SLFQSLFKSASFVLDLMLKAFLLLALPLEQCALCLVTLVGMLIGPAGDDEQTDRQGGQYKRILLEELNQRDVWYQESNGAQQCTACQDRYEQQSCQAARPSTTMIDVCA